MPDTFSQLSSCLQQEGKYSRSCSNMNRCGSLVSVLEAKLQNHPRFEQWRATEQAPRDVVWLWQQG